MTSECCGSVGSSVVHQSKRETKRARLWKVNEAAAVGAAAPAQ
jgi:hypothetical protein